MDNEYLHSARDARNKYAVLKTQVLKIRSSKATVPIIILEGKNDIGPYQTWIKRINKNLEYIPILAHGKGQSLNFYSKLINESQDWKKFIYFIVDRDFDELRGRPESDIIFHTCAYSMENYLISTEALHSILVDEFEYIGNEESIKKILDHYEKLLSDACVALKEANKRIYLSQKNSLGGESKENKINRYLEITLSNVRKVHDDADLKILIPLKSEPTQQELTEMELIFSALEEPERRYRGKFLFDFFINWLCALAEDRKSGGLFFTEPKAIKFYAPVLTHRSLASRVEGPEKLYLFVEKIYSDAMAA